MKTTPSKYIDLEPQVSDYYGTIPGQERRAGICDALRYLDSHPEHVPGRTITESEAWDIAGRTFHRWGSVEELASHLRGTFRQLGITVVPDPGPTNAEKLHKLIDEGECPWPRGPATIATFLDRHGVKAPGGNEPEPTERDLAWWIENANVNDAEDCEACEGDLCPVHHGIALGIEFVTEKIAALGADPELFNSIPNPPKAPGGDDER